MAQLVKNPPAMWENWVPSLGWEDPLEKGKATHSSILAWRIPPAESMGSQSQTRLIDFHFHFPSFVTNYGEIDDLHCKGRKTGGTKQLLDEGEKE